MKKLVFTFSLLMIFNLTHAQIRWISDFKTAQKAAISQNKFIVMDFWAVWCGPCKEMDSKMWNTEEMNSISDKFVYLKIDVDSNRDLAVRYSATSIPKVIIIDPLGNEIWEETGFATAQRYMKVFNAFPEAELPGVHMDKLLKKEGDDNTLFSVGAAYQEIGKLSESPTLSRGFFGLSDRYFRQVNKKSSNKDLATEAAFHLVLNDAYRGAIKKAIKKVEKMDEDDMKNFILAYCYKCDGQLEKMNEFVQKIQSKELLAQLDNQ